MQRGTAASVATTSPAPYQSEGGYTSSSPTGQTDPSRFTAGTEHGFFGTPSAVCRRAGRSSTRPAEAKRCSDVPRKDACRAAQECSRGIANREPDEGHRSFIEANRIDIVVMNTVAPYRHRRCRHWQRCRGVAAPLGFSLALKPPGRQAPIGKDYPRTTVPPRR